MPYRETEFANGEVYHTILRGIDGNPIFKSTDDYYRGIFSMYEFNNAQPTTIQRRREERARFKRAAKEARGRPTSTGLGGDAAVEQDTREKLVDVCAFCLMPNHIHLLLRQKTERGIHNFMVKIGSGYGRYLNQKNGRKGYVFQNRFQSVHIESNDHLLVAVNYIHANPIALIEPGFKEVGIKNYSAAEVLDFLRDGYRWSSFPDYAGVKNFPSVTDRGLVAGIMHGSSGVMDTLMDWVVYKKELAAYENALQQQTKDVKPVDARRPRI